MAKKKLVKKNKKVETYQEPAGTITPSNDNFSTSETDEIAEEQLNNSSLSYLKQQGLSGAQAQAQVQSSNISYGDNSDVSYQSGSSNNQQKNLVSPNIQQSLSNIDTEPINLDEINNSFRSSKEELVLPNFKRIRLNEQQESKESDIVTNQEQTSTETPTETLSQNPERPGDPTGYTQHVNQRDINQRDKFNGINPKERPDIKQNMSDVLKNFKNFDPKSNDLKIETPTIPTEKKPNIFGKTWNNIKAGGAVVRDNPQAMELGMTVGTHLFGKDVDRTKAEQLGWGVAKQGASLSGNGYVVGAVYGLDLTDKAFATKVDGVDFVSTKADAGFGTDFLKKGFYSGKSVGTFGQMIGDYDFQKKLRNDAIFNFYERRYYADKAQDYRDRASVDNTAQINDYNNKRLGVTDQYGYITIGKQGTILTLAKQIISRHKINQDVQKFQKGNKINKTRTLEELIDYAKQKNPRFIQRLFEKPRGIEFEDKGIKQRGNIYLAWDYKPDSNKQIAIVFPTIQEEYLNGPLKYYNNEAFDRALENNDYLEMTPEEAEIFSENYKKGWPFMFNIDWTNDDSIIENLPKHKEGGTLQKVPLPLVTLDLLIPEFQQGGRFENYNDVINFYKDYDLSNVNFIIDNNPRTEGNNIYIKNDEDAIHELWHYLSQNYPNEIYKEWYDNLNDEKISNFGGDLKFVKRTGDPSEFYNPVELEARIKAAQYKTKGQNYTKEFFQNLRKNENQYGYNMRDLLHMFNDDSLVKIFNIKSTEKFQQGGEINVIPGGALHAHKHNMDIEGITKKGIPVVSQFEGGEIEQQAEIEKNEIIYRLQVTEKLEDLYKRYYSDEATQKDKDEFALEAGKLLVQETLYNIQDNTGLIDEIQI